MIIKIRYRPFLFPFYITKRVEVPTNWDQCTGKQLLALLYSQQEGATDSRFISLFCNIPYRISKRFSKFETFCLIEEIEKVSLSPFTGKFFIEEIKCGNETLCAPEARMRMVTFGQFIFFDAYFNDPSPESRAKFITHLYLAKGEQFDESACLERAEKLTIPDQIIETIHFNYQLFYDFFARAYPLLFSISVNSVDSVNSASKYDPRGWLKIYESIRGKDIVNDDKYVAIPVNTMFRYLNELQKENARTRNKNPNS